jgi:hypothetical protein
MDGFLWFSTGYTALEINNRDFTKRVFIAFLITTNIVKWYIYIYEKSYWKVKQIDDIKIARRVNE